MKRRGLGRIPATYQEALWAGLVLLLSLYFFFKAGEILRIQPKGQLGPDFWPRVILGGLITLSLLKAALALMKARRGGIIPEKVATEVVEPARNPRRLVVGILLVIAYAASTDLFGFPLANFLFLLSFMYLGGMRRPLWISLLSTLGTIGLLYIFIKLVYVPLPRGAGVFDDLTIALYRFLRIF